jgi:hypothetical protein
MLGESAGHRSKTDSIAPFFDASSACNVCLAETAIVSRSRSMSYEASSQSEPGSRQSKVRTASKDGSFPLTTGDIRPDPKVLSPAERMSEFGRLMLRAIERRRARKSS